MTGHTLMHVGVVSGGLTLWYASLRYMQLQPWPALYIGGAKDIPALLF